MMPNRIIKESIKTSDEIDCLTWFQEVMFYRLMTTVDDFGCYKASPNLLKNVLFPTKEEKDVSVQDLKDGLDALEKSGLIKRYSNEGKDFLYLVTWAEHQRIRNKKSHFPEPFEGYFQKAKDGKKQPDDDDDDDSCGNPQTIVRKSRSNVSKLSSQSNPIQSNPKEEEEEKIPFIDDGEARKIRQDHEEVFSELKRAGFPMSEGLMDMAVKLYADHGKDRLIAAIRDCIGANGNKVSYLNKILKRMKTEGSDDELSKAWKSSKKWGDMA